MHVLPFGFSHEKLKTRRWCSTGLFVFWVQLRPVFYCFDPCQWNHIKDKRVIVDFFKSVLCKKSPTYSSRHIGNDRIARTELPHAACFKGIAV